MEIYDEKYIKWKTKKKQLTTKNKIEVLICKPKGNQIKSEKHE